MGVENSKALEAARRSLRAAIKLSMQGSYSRRAPEPASLPHFAMARRLLDEVLEQHPDNREALVMMSQLLEGLLEFNAAAQFLTRAFDAGEPRTNKSLKKLALLQENAREWEQLSLSSEKLSELGRYLESKGVGPNHRTIEHTRKWLVDEVADPEDVLAALGRRGAFSDFQVLANIVYG